MIATAFGDITRMKEMNQLAKETALLAMSSMRRYRRQGIHRLIQCRKL